MTCPRCNHPDHPGDACMMDLILEPQMKIEGDAVFARDGRIRYELRRWWVPEPRRWISWLMLNPSIADKNRLDLTTMRVTDFSRAWGYDGWIVANTYPFVSSTPAEMWAWSRWDAKIVPDWEARDDMQLNLKCIEVIARKSSLRMVAFGAEPVLRNEPWLEQCLEAYSQPSDIEGGAHLYCLGTTKSGQPIHPLARGRNRVPNDAIPILWERP